MHLKRIKVKSLFGMFDHDIPLNLDDKITIIHGPNGIGKTILLKIINSIFQTRYAQLRSIPFKEFILDFDDNSKLTLKSSLSNAKPESDEEKISKQMVLEYKKSGSKKQTYEIKRMSRLEMRKLERGIPLHYVEREIPFLDRIGSHEWQDMRTGENYDLDDIMELYPNIFPQVSDSLAEFDPDWLKNIKESIHVRFIDTERLRKYYDLGERRHYKIDTHAYLSVVEYSRELSEAIKKKLEEYAALSQSLDRTFPHRIVKDKGLEDTTIDELKSEIQELERKRSRLMSAGFLDKEQEIQLQDIDNIDKNKINVLSVYVEDVKLKLNIFDELTNKIDLLINIINNRFRYKALNINKEKGFLFFNSNNTEISPQNLSSGEQHELILFYELLFKVSPNSLILIDEPELSLHVEWQQQFLKDLLDITKLTGFNILIATHSPQIIHDRWDLTVELKGNDNQK